MDAYKQTHTSYMHVNTARTVIIEYFQVVGSHSDVVYMYM